MGYINQNAVTETTKYGIWQSAKGYITSPEDQLQSYSDLANTKVKGFRGDLASSTYKVTGKYVAFDGSVQYSIYSLAGKWLGYVDATDQKLATGAQGTIVTDNIGAPYFVTTKKGQTIWSSFDFHKGKSTTAYYQNTYQIRGVYHHANGSDYYSLYDHTGKWMGYINTKNGTQTDKTSGNWQSNNQTVKIAKRGYPIWHRFFNHQVNSTSKLMNKTYRTTGKYHNFNGSWYYSLYSGKTWIGYVNATALRVIK